MKKMDDMNENAVLVLQTKMAKGSKAWGAGFVFKNNVTIKNEKKLETSRE